MDFSAWIVSGLMLVAGATWLIVYNADVLLGATMRVSAAIRALAPVLKMAMAYPLRERFRTGVTLAMFTLVVFTIVVGATTSRAFLRAIDDVEPSAAASTSRAQVAPTSPLGDAGAVDARARRSRDASTSSRASRCSRPRRRQAGDAGDGEPIRCAASTTPSSNATTYGFAATREGLRLAARRLAGARAPRRTLAVVDALAAPRRDNWGFGVAARLPAARLLHRGRGVRSGAGRRPRPADRATSPASRSSACSRTRVPIDMAGTLDVAADARGASSATARRADHPPPQRRAGRRPRRAAARELERAFLANGLEAESMRERARTTPSARPTRSTG